MIKSRFVTPYKKDGKTTFGNSIAKKSGVYIIKKKGVVVYIGESHTNNLYKTLYRHFQSWIDVQKRVVFKNDKSSGAIKVRVIITTPKQAIRLQKYLIRKMKPRLNTMQYTIEEEKEFAKIEKQNKKIAEDYFGTPVDHAPF